MSNSVLICGSIAYDTLTTFEGYFKDHILAEHIQSLSVSFLVPSMRKEFGGCAGNIAYNLKLLGGEPIPVGTVGKDSEPYIERLKDLGIASHKVRVLDDMFTPQCYIVTDHASNQITSFHPGAMERSVENDLGTEQAGWGIVAPDAKDAMLTHAKRFVEKQIPFIFDLGQAMPLFGRDDLLAMIELADIFTVNDYEAAVVLERTGLTMEALSHKLRAVVVTRGAQGSSLYIDGQETKIDPILVEKAVDPTGCGDAHRGGLLFGLSQGWDLEKSCQLANVMGALKVASVGPQNHQQSKEEISALVQSSYGWSLV